MINAPEFICHISMLYPKSKWAGKDRPVNPSRNLLLTSTCSHPHKYGELSTR
jgi:hypothetical protein